MELRRNMPLVQVQVNGRGPYTFGIDTGTGTEALVAPALAEELGLSTIGTVEAGDPSGKNPRQLPQVRLAKLSVAGVDFAGITAAVYAPSQAEGRCDGRAGRSGASTTLSPVVNRARGHEAVEGGKLSPLLDPRTLRLPDAEAAHAAVACGAAAGKVVVTVAERRATPGRRSLR